MVVVVEVEVEEVGVEVVVEVVVEEVGVFFLWSSPGSSPSRDATVTACKSCISGSNSC